MSKQKGNTMVVLIIIVVLVALAFWWLMRSGYKFPGQTAFNPSAIQDTAGLDAAAKTLDSTDLNQMDSGMSQISSDASSF